MRQFVYLGEIDGGSITEFFKCCRRSYRVLVISFSVATASSADEFDQIERALGANGKTQEAPIFLDTRRIEDIIGHSGINEGGVLKLTVGRTGVMSHGMELTSSMGLNSWAGFTGTNQRAHVAGEIAATAAKVHPVVRAWRSGGIDVVGLHNHMLDDQPRIFFVHYWGAGPVEELAERLRLQSIPLTSPSAAALLQPQSLPLPTDTPQFSAQTLANVASVYHQVTPENINHYTVQRVLNVEGTVEGRDLGSVARVIERKIADLGKLPAGTFITLRGQYEVMSQSFRSMGMGLILAIVLVYFLMVVLFQSWLDPFIIMMAVPGALVGILWMLAFTGTSINVESLMGSIMAVGIAQSNAILLVSFANDIRVEQGKSAYEAIIEAARTRLRPVLMTALAMILGMLPMAFGMGEGGEQNAPLGRAVVGGLIVATVVTLFIVPLIYSLLRKALPSKHVLEQRFRERSAGG